MKKKFPKQYDPKMVEEIVYSFWLENGCFKQSEDQSKETFSVIMPPPNVTGRLHMGHALDNTLQDILVRYKRMKGFNTLWVPGLDHSAIATESKVVNMLKEKGISKEDLTREQFLEYAFAWKEKYGNIIVDQVKKLGISAEWDKIKFTMDPTCSAAVKKVFVDLYNEGLIYKGEKIINWCPNCGTSLSDIEVDFCEQSGKLWYIKYCVVGGTKEDYILVATTRPETILGDTAVAVHPEDERYKKFIGKKVLVPIINREVEVIADDFVEKEYGTGAVKITPAHDINDFEVGLRHGLEVLNVISKKGKMLENSGKYKDLGVKEARRAILNDLNDSGLLEKTEDITHNVGKCYRCSCDVEPLVASQWFISMKSIAKPAIECVEDGRVKFVPERFSKIYLNWLLNIRDWCISRQIWWGHRIPAYYCKDCGNIAVSAEEVKVCPRCKSTAVYQDEDTLDTWFSAGLWPFSVFDWPEKNADYYKFFPTSVLVTGYDIIFFWVARMVMGSLKFTGEVPFKHILIHGLVRDSLGRKMSKSLGNGIDPLDVINEVGADALRFTLVLNNTIGNDVRFSDEKLTASRNFINKVFNAARYIYLKVEDDLDTLDYLKMPDNLCCEDKWILAKLNVLIKEVTENLDTFEFGVALFKIYEFFWDSFCDWYIELSKVRLSQDDISETTKNATKSVLVFVLVNILKTLHPFTPFITEDLWQTFTEGKFGPLMQSAYPNVCEELALSKDTKCVELAIKIIKAIRKRRKDLNVPAGKILKEIFIEIENPEMIEPSVIFIKRLARVSELRVSREVLCSETESKFNIIVVENTKLYIRNDELFNKEEEIQKLSKDLESSEAELEKVENQLSNKDFLEKAPSQVVEKIKLNGETLRSKIKKIKKSISCFRNN